MSGLHSLLLTQCADVLPCKGTKHPRVPDDIKKAPGIHHFTPPTAHADLQPAAQVHQHQQYNWVQALSRQKQSTASPKTLVYIQTHEQVSAGISLLFTAKWFSRSHGQEQGPDYSYCWFIWKMAPKNWQSPLQSLLQNRFICIIQLKSVSSNQMKEHKFMTKLLRQFSH